jgi:hypothetical protein
MKSILVYYTFQKNQVESIFNVFAIPNTFNSLSDVKFYNFSEIK